MREQTRARHRPTLPARLGRALVAASGAALVLLQASCLFTMGQGEDCSESVVCDADQVESRRVCGSDGRTYFCEAQVLCEGQTLDPNGTACGESTCDEYACDRDCTFFSKRDDDDCETCECVDRTQCPSLARSCPNLATSALSLDPRSFVQDADGCPTCQLVGGCVDDDADCAEVCDGDVLGVYTSLRLECSVCSCAAE